jgi:C4-dicarboxylate transporter DctM subunit
MDIAVLLGIFTVLMLIGVPMGITLGVSGITALIIFDPGYKMAGMNFVSGIASFPLLAIPFFVLAGCLLQKAKLAELIAEFFELLVGRSIGGLAIVSVVTCMFWGAISGSGPATTVAVGMILMTPMLKHGYDRAFAAATIANASDLSIIIPPSIAFIIYGNITGTSVSALFMGGIIPGIMMGLGVILVAWWVSWRRGYRGLEKRGSAVEILRAFRKASWAMLAPVIILGGIYSGFFTPTEAAVVAVVYSFLVAILIYRTVKFSQLPEILVDTAVMTAVIMFIVVFAGIFSWAASTTGLISKTAELIISASPNMLMTILGINLLLLVLGMFLDAISISYLVMPILLPVMRVFNIDPVWYGVIFITALAIGQATPPVGVNLFTVANITKVSVDSISRQMIPYIIVNIIILTLISLFASISLLLPVLSGLYKT